MAGQGVAGHARRGAGRAPPPPGPSAKRPCASPRRHRRDYSPGPVLTWLGSTRLAVRRIGLGLAALGGPGYINLGRAADLAGGTGKESTERAAQPALECLRAGRSLLRSGPLPRGGRGVPRRVARAPRARSERGDGRLEVGLPVHGELARGRARARVRDLSLAMLSRQLVESRQLLGARLRLYQIHSARLDSGVLEDRAVLEELARLGASGLSIGPTVTDRGSGRRSSERSSSAASIRFRRRGICSNVRPAPRSPPLTRRESA